MSRLFLKPLSNGDIAEMAQADLIERSRQFDEGSLIQQGFNDMGRALRLRNSGTRQKLATDYTMCFDGISSIDDLVAVPYASVFLSESGLLNQAPRNEVYHLFLSEGVKLKPDINLPEDHISFELEFLAVLSERAQVNFMDHDIDRTIHYLTVSKSFIEENVLTWFAAFVDRAARILKTRFYKGLLKATQGYLDLDLDVLRDLYDVLSRGLETRPS